ncbi:hypothetical protein A1D31_37830 [Bradyrhizobium liaoningense]|nr:hypothetical protein A1D31_37830 [Bradyrhizobium liaoningense]
MSQQLYHTSDRSPIGKIARNGARAEQALPATIEFLADHNLTEALFWVLSRIFRTFDQATAPVSESCG